MKVFITATKAGQGFSHNPIIRKACPLLQGNPFKPCFSYVRLSALLTIFQQMTVLALTSYR